MMKIDENEEMI